jgi:hypothetical protein
MLSKRSWLVIGMVATLLAVTGGIFFCTDLPQNSELPLSDYPELFQKDGLIIVGESASQIELESAEAIAAELERITGHKPITKADSEVSQNGKFDHNLILVGTPHSNSLLQEVYSVTNATRVTAGYPGENKGILEILANPWNVDGALLLVGGSDERGVKVGCQMMRDIGNLGVPKMSAPLSGAVYLVPSDPSIRILGFRACTGDEYYLGRYVISLKRIDDARFIPAIEYDAPVPSSSSYDARIDELKGTLEIVNPRITSGTIRTHGYEPGAFKKVDSLLVYVDEIVQVSSTECISTTPILDKK